MESTDISTWESATRRRIRHVGGIALAAAISLTPAVLAQHDCLPYDPTEDGEVINSSWLTPDDQDDYQIVIPEDPGGGYVIASITAMAPAEPIMRILPPLSSTPIGPIGTDSNGPSPHTLTVAFEVDADTTFDVEIIEDAALPKDDHPVPYTWSWTFYSRVDCYEPNDGIPTDWPLPTLTAREIPLDQELSGTPLAGYLTDSIPAGSDNNYDWYAVTVDVPTQLWAATTSIPDDMRISVRIFDDGGNVLVSSPNAPEGAPVTAGPAAVDPGTYYLAVLPYDRGPGFVTLSEGGQIPDHFVTPYTFVVSTEEIPPCGYMAVFCDGFESGDTNLWSASTP